MQEQDDFIMKAQADFISRENTENSNSCFEVVEDLTPLPGDFFEGDLKKDEDLNCVTGKSNDFGGNNAGFESMFPPSPCVGEPNKMQELFPPSPLGGEKEEILSHHQQQNLQTNLDKLQKNLQKQTDLTEFEKEKRDFIAKYGEYEETLERNNDVDSGLGKNLKDDETRNYVEQKELKIGKINNINSKQNESKNQNDSEHSNGNSFLKDWFKRRHEIDLKCVC